MILNDLTLCLIALGGVFIAGLSIYSVWQSHKTASRRSSHRPVVHREPVLQASEPPGSFSVHTAPIARVHSPLDIEKNAIDPGALNHIDSPLETQSSRQAQPIPLYETPGLSLQVHPAEALAATPLHDLPSVPEPTPFTIKTEHVIDQMDALIDVIVPIHLEGPVTGKVLQAHLPAAAHIGNQPFLIEALNERTRDWGHPVLGQHYTEIRGAIQLANRRGPINELEYSEFIQKLEALSLSLGGVADVPDMPDVIARARELDEFASQHDAQLAVHLRARNTGWSLGYIQQCAARCGFVKGGRGCLVMPSSEAGAPPVLTLQFDAQVAIAEDPNQAVLNALTLHFDVPQTEARVQAFEQWYQCARRLAEVMDASLVDDYGKGLDEEGLASIDQGLERLYAALEEHGVAAGSMAARRLFS